jgi:hypothetical protein
LANFGEIVSTMVLSTQWHTFALCPVGEA